MQYQGRYTKSFLVTLMLLPAVVSTIIMMVNGSVGAGVAVAGAFSLVRFRSAPGTGREITMLFLAMGAGLIVGMGYLAFALLFAVIMSVMNVVFHRLDFGEKEKELRYRTLSIMIPESLDYSGVFDEVLRHYATDYTLTRVKTTNMGSMFRLSYDLTLREGIISLQGVDFMTQAVLNTQLYQKMFAEQAHFKNWLMSQPPEEVLNHAYEYTCREDILLSLEYNDLSPRQAKALLKSPTPLADVFKKWEATVDTASIKHDIEKTRQEKESAPAAPEKAAPKKDADDMILDELLGAPIQKEQPSPENPTAAKTEKSPPSEPTSGTQRKTAEGTAKESRPSVREELREIKAARQEKAEIPKQQEAARPSKQQLPTVNMHQNPGKKKPKQKAR